MSKLLHSEGAIIQNAQQMELYNQKDKMRPRNLNS